MSAFKRYLQNEAHVICIHATTADYCFNSAAFKCFLSSRGDTQKTPKEVETQEQGQEVLT